MKASGGESRRGFEAKQAAEQGFGVDWRSPSMALLMAYLREREVRERERKTGEEEKTNKRR